MAAALARRMTRTGALLALAPLAISAGPALAQAGDADSASVAVNGTVAPLCILGVPSQATVDLGQMVATSGARVGRIAVLPVQTVTLPASFCNFAGSMVTVDATALVAASSATPQPGFARAVNFTASATGWAGGDASATSTATANGGSPTGSGNGAIQPLPKIADIEVDLSGFTVPSDALLVAGTYAGQVTVTLGPAATN